MSIADHRDYLSIGHAMEAKELKDRIAALERVIKEDRLSLDAWKKRAKDAEEKLLKVNELAERETWTWVENTCLITSGVKRITPDQILEIVSDVPSEVD